LPDWRHKARDVKLHKYGDLSFTFQGKQTTVSQWWAQVQFKVSRWLNAAHEVEVPEFEDTVLEYHQLSQNVTPITTPSSESAEDNWNTPVPTERSGIKKHVKHDSGIGMEMEHAMGLHRSSA